MSEPTAAPEQPGTSRVFFRADIKLADKTLAAIDAATLRQADDGLRPHLGASLIGRPCARALWYSFRWATAPRHEPRMLRLFARGQREEEYLAALLRSAGVTVVTVDPSTGQQWRFGSGHFGGSMDGACVGLPEAPKTWHVLEFKTHSAKSFNELTAKGVQAAKPEHYAQMQCYMAWTGMQRALYMAVCKDDDRLHLERVDYDADAAEALFAKAQRVIDAAEPPPRVSDDPAWYECKWCDYADLCHGQAVPVPHCRTCLHATPEPNGTWSCARHQAGDIPIQWQKRGCDAHRYIPALLSNWAEVVDASDADNWVRYRLKSTGAEFTNGQPPVGLSSEEIHACDDKRALAVVEQEFQDLRAAFGGKIVA